MTIIGFCIFTLEIVLSAYAKNGYLFSFFFWLDLISTASMLLDVGWISDVVFSTDSGTSSPFSSSGSTSAAQVAAAAKTSRIGTRTAKLIRIIRLIRMIRIVKLYKEAEKERKKKKGSWLYKFFCFPRKQKM